MTSQKGKGSGSLANQLEQMLAPPVKAMGYDLISLEYQHKTRAGAAVIRLFIDHLAPAQEHIGIEDCVKVDQGLDEFVQTDDFAAIIPGDFTLEVSSPGLDRPLTREEHFQHYTGSKARIKTYRALLAEEVNNSAYFTNHPKQKNFMGVLMNFENSNVVMRVDAQKITIPFAQIAKANLEVADDILRGHMLENKKKHNNKKVNL